jgi:hypothetical protein
MSNKLEEYIKTLLEDQSLYNELSTLLNNTNTNFSTCSYVSNELIITPTTTGLSFLANYNFLTIVNMLIPDLFLECTTNSYNNDQERSIYLQNSCPVYTYTIEGKNDYGNPSESVNITLNFQNIIDPELIAAFFYFNFTTDYTEDSTQFVRLISLEKRVEDYLLNKPSNNSSKYTEPQTIFAEIFSSNSILVQIIEFSNKLNEVLGVNKNGTNICQYNIPWLFTYNCLGNIVNILIPYNSFNSNKSLYALEYSDLFYLSNIRLTITTLIESAYKYNQNKELINIIKKSNIFNIIEIALAVYNNILQQISYILSNKIYVEQPYQNPINLFKCLILYYNYVQNATFLNNQSTSSNINIKNTNNTLLYLEKLIANFNK